MLEATVLFLLHKQRLYPSVARYLQNQQLIFTHSYRKPKNAASIVFEQEADLEILSLALTHAKMK